MQHFTGIGGYLETVIAKCLQFVSIWLHHLLPRRRAFWLIVGKLDFNLLCGRGCGAETENRGKADSLGFDRFHLFSSSLRFEMALPLVGREMVFWFWVLSGPLFLTFSLLLRRRRAGRRHSQRSCPAPM